MVLTEQAHRAASERAAERLARRGPLPGGMAAKDWSRFTKRITVDATTRAIYNAWTIPDEIQKWFLSRAQFTTRTGQQRTSAERAAPGDRYRFEWFGYADGSPETGIVIEANGHDAFSFTFADDCVVDVLILSEAGEKIVQLTQKNIAPDDDLRVYLGCSEGWVFYLANLKSYLENGIDLRNRNDRVAKVINS